MPMYTVETSKLAERYTAKHFPTLPGTQFSHSLMRGNQTNQSLHVLQKIDLDIDIDI